MKNGEHERQATFLARFSSTQLAVTGMVGAVIVVVLLIAATAFT